MRYTKADVIFVAGFLSPILLVAGLFGLASISWASNQSRLNTQARELLRETTDEVSPTLESIFATDEKTVEEQQIRQSQQAKWDELILGCDFVLRWMNSQTTPEEEEQSYRIVPPDDSGQSTKKLSKILKRTQPILKQLDELAASSEPSIAEAMHDRVGYAGVVRGELENVPIYSLYQVCYLAFRHSISTADQERALDSAERLLNLLTRPPGSLGAMFSTQSSLRSIRESLVFEFWEPLQLQRLHERLGKSPDFSDALDKHDLTKAVLLKSAVQNVRKLRTLSWLTPYISVSRDPRANGQHTIAPSQKLKIIKLFSPETNASDPIGPDLAFSFDRWLNRPGMQSIELKVSWVAQRNYYRSTAELVEKDRVFTRAAIGIRMIYLQTGSYPRSLGELTTLQWTDNEIAEAKKLLEWEHDPSTDERTLTAKYATWMKDADGELVDGGFSKQVRFAD